MGGRLLGSRICKFCLSFPLLVFLIYIHYITHTLQMKKKKKYIDIVELESLPQSLAYLHLFLLASNLDLKRNNIAVDTSQSTNRTNTMVFLDQSVLG